MAAGGNSLLWNAQMKTLRTMKQLLLEFRDHGKDLWTYWLDLRTC